VKHWGTRPFENEEAQSFATAIIAGGEMESVMRALDIDADDYIDADVAQRALVAAEVLAAIRGKPSSEMPMQLRRWVMRQPRPTTVMLKKARRALKLVAAKKHADNSELRQLFEGRLALWGETMRDLFRRLKD
jgi:hypothetical protein